MSRTQLDEFSAASHDKAARATKDGLFDNELIPIAGLTHDEIIRPAPPSIRSPRCGRRSTAMRSKSASRRSTGRSPG
ncbi:thiolase, N-terminal domain protein [Mycobacterium ulcerans str. Harvey]|uniref:Thiolase, N-terminal domain protein n=1 Tax=Mycobacterium ulcerans str. Harvey TaxID=1299332 RepID=A0ABN0QY24_MYCUL|nr:thiolase, N-terminal domain protein [Mycobacterium ulcerans str. Harvey]